MSARPPAAQRAEGRDDCRGSADLHGWPRRRQPCLQRRCVERHPVFTDGPYVETKDHLGGFAVVDVANEDAARLWAGRIAVACGWPQEVRRFQVPAPGPGPRDEVAVAK